MPPKHSICLFYALEDMEDEPGWSTGSASYLEDIKSLDDGSLERLLNELMATTVAQVGGCSLEAKEGHTLRLTPGGDLELRGPEGRRATTPKDISAQFRSVTRNDFSVVFDFQGLFTNNVGSLAMALVTRGDASPSSSSDLDVGEEWLDELELALLYSGVLDAPILGSDLKVGRALFALMRRIAERGERCSLRSAGLSIDMDAPRADLDDGWNFVSDYAVTASVDGLRYEGGEGDEAALRAMGAALKAPRSKLTLYTGRLLTRRVGAFQLVAPSRAA